MVFVLSLQWATGEGLNKFATISVPTFPRDLTIPLILTAIPKTLLMLET